MNKILCLIPGLFFTLIAMAQPFNYIQPINPADTGLVSSASRRTWNMQYTSTPIVVDGIKDAEWDLVIPQPFDRYIMGRTNYGTPNCAAGTYCFAPDAPPNRTPNNAADFSGNYRVMYDSDYIYAFYDITDSEANDNIINAGVQERLEIVEAPYPDSAEEVLKGKPFPPFSGVAPHNNMKFCYWHYLGAFKFNFFLNGSAVKIDMDTRADAVKIDYQQRINACQAAWTLKGDGSGYYLEIALSLKVSLADSSNAPYTMPAAGKSKSIAFDMFVYDRDCGKNQIESSWNALDGCVWDNMLYTGKLVINGIPGGCPSTVPSANNASVCHGKSATLTATGGKNYRWYNTLSGGSPIATTAVYTTPNLDSNKTYYVANYDSCESARKAVTVSIVSQLSVKINPLKNNHFDCNSAPEQLSATPSGGTFSGDGVEMGYFVPALSKINHINSIYYNYGDTLSSCNGKDSLHVYVFPCIGLEDGSEKEVNIYPNPTNGNITIEINNVKEEISLQILDELGRVVAEDQKSIIGTYTNNLNLSAYPAGIYVVKVKMNDRIITTKIIKNQ